MIGVLTCERTLIGRPQVYFAGSFLRASLTGHPTL
jgi:hypothetical protein